MPFAQLESYVNEHLGQKWLLTASLELTSRCNANCDFCINKLRRVKQQDESELTFHDWVDVLDQLLELGCIQLQISGGEPFLREDAIDIIAAARARGFAIGVITNAQLLTKNHIYQLADLTLSSVLISIHAASRELYKEMFGIDYDPERVFEKIELMVRLGIPVHTSMVVIKKNIHEWQLLRDRLARTGLHPAFMHFNSVRNGEEGLYNSDEMAPDDQLIHLYKETFIPGEGRRGVLCTAGRSQLAIDANGDVKPCGLLNLRIGNIRTESLSNLWKSSPTLSVLRMLQKESFRCHKCEYKHFCSICMADFMNDTGNIFTPGPDSCKFGRIFTTVAQGGVVSENP